MDTPSSVSPETVQRKPDMGGDEDVRYSWKLLRAGSLWLDGGSMFGIIPRAVWHRTVPCDHQGRIECAHNCLLLEPVGDVHAPRKTVIEVGSGDKFDEKNRKIFGLGDYSIIDALADAGCTCEEVEQVIVSHLHFDHAGGLTRASAEGPAPTFPNARITVQKREWEDAMANRSVMTRTYLRENLDPIQHQMNLIDSAVPFPRGYVPARDELPQTTLEERETQVLPGIYSFRVPGHTWGQHAIWFTDDRGREVVFTPDVLPTINHVGAAYNMAYDVEPYISTVTRRWFLQEAAQRGWLLVLDHEPREPRCRVTPDGKGWFVLQPGAE